MTLEEVVPSAYTALQHAVAKIHAETARLTTEQAKLQELQTQLAVRERALIGREEAVNQVSKMLSLERAKVKAGLEREQSYADKLEKARAELGAKSAQLTKIGSAFPQLVQP